MMFAPTKPTYFLMEQKCKIYEEIHLQNAYVKVGKHYYF